MYDFTQNKKLMYKYYFLPRLHKKFSNAFKIYSYVQTMEGNARGTEII